VIGIAARDERRGDEHDASSHGRSPLLIARTSRSVPRGSLGILAASRDKARYLAPRVDPCATRGSDAHAARALDISADVRAVAARFNDWPR
jgi:hypothetical protein